MPDSTYEVSKNAETSRNKKNLVNDRLSPVSRYGISRGAKNTEEKQYKTEEMSDNIVVPLQYKITVTFQLYSS